MSFDDQVDKVSSEVASKAMELIEKYGLPETQENANIFQDAITCGIELIVPHACEIVKQIKMVYEKQIDDILSDDTH